MCLSLIILNVHSYITHIYFPILCCTWLAVPLRQVAALVGGKRLRATEKIFQPYRVTDVPRGRYCSRREPGTASADATATVTANFPHLRGSISCWSSGHQTRFPHATTIPPKQSRFPTQSTCGIFPPAVWTNSRASESNAPCRTHRVRQYTTRKY
jgi:hypothetical protein